MKVQCKIDKNKILKQILKAKISLKQKLQIHYKQ